MPHNPWNKEELRKAADRIIEPALRPQRPFGGSLIDKLKLAATNARLPKLPRL